MGADLYIKNMEREAQYTGYEVSERAVNIGYFRDCYNPGGLFAFLTANLSETYSWWTFRKQFDKYFTDDDGDGDKDMNVEGCKEFLKIIMNAKSKIEKKDKLYLEEWSIDDPEDKSVPLTEQQVKEYKEWLDLLIKFLNLAIEVKSPVIWSV